MERKQFKTLIDAPRERVWDILWNDANYREWTSVFSEGSRAETDWKKGSKVLFLNASNEGMVSQIEENIPNEFLSIKHLGVVNNGVEDTTSEKVREWAGAVENYRLQTVNDKTQLIVDMDVTDEYNDYFSKTWPLALEKVRAMAERVNVNA